MTKKMTLRFTSAVLASVLAVGIGGQALAMEWYPSRTQSEVEVVETTTATEDGATIVVTDHATVDAAGAVVSVETSQEAVIQVTPVSETLAANANAAAENPGATADQMAGMLTDSGLTYAANGQLNNLYNQVTAASSTQQLLETTAPAVAASFESVVGESANQYTPIALYDIALSAGAASALEKTGSAQIAIAVPGVAEGTSLVAVCWDRSGNSRLVPVTVKNGAVYLTVSTSGPVMIMARAQN